MAEVTIRKAGGILQVIPPCTELLADALKCQRRVQVKVNNRSSFQCIDLDLYEVRKDQEDRQYLITHTGLMCRIVRTLKSFNMDINVEDLRPLELETPKWEFIDTPRPGQDVILAKVACTERGQLVAPTGDGKSWIICQICRMYPNTPILIVVASRSEAKNIRDRLVGYFPSSEIGQLGGFKHELDGRITICVRNSLALADSLARKPKIILYDEVHTAAGPHTSYMLGHLSEAGPRMFGFTATPEMRTDNADLVVEALFGPIIHETSYQESQSAGNIVPIRVLMQTVGNGPILSYKRTDSINRHGIWRNEIRNKQIAEDALRVSSNGEQLMIKVATVEHGLELLRWLPDFVFVYSSMSKELRERYEAMGVIKPGEHPISKRQQETLQDLFQRGEIKRVIATCWNQGVNFPGLQVLIRADGLAADIQNVQLPGRLSRLDDGKEYGLLIDYMDDWAPTLNRRAKGRVRMYKKKGWDVRLPRKFGRDGT